MTNSFRVVSSTSQVPLKPGRIIRLSPAQSRRWSRSCPQTIEIPSRTRQYSHSSYSTRHLPGVDSQIPANSPPGCVSISQVRNLGLPEIIRSGDGVLSEGVSARAARSRTSRPITARTPAGWIAFHAPEQSSSASAQGRPRTSCAIGVDRAPSQQRSSIRLRSRVSPRTGRVKQLSPAP